MIRVLSLMVLGLMLNFGGHQDEDAPPNPEMQREEIVNLTISANEDSLAYPPQLDARLAYLAMDVGTADSAPTEAEQREFEKLKRQSGELVGRWDDLQRRDLAAFQKLTAEGSLSTVVVPPAGRAAEEDVPAH